MSTYKTKDGSWPLSVRVRDYFESHIRHRGEGYFQHGSVKLLTRNDTAISLSVMGTDVYTIRLDWSVAQSLNELSIFCSCPYFAGGHICKHCWAAVLYLDYEGVSQGIPGKRNPKLIQEHDLNPSRSVAPESPPSQPKIWLKQLQSLQNTQEQALQAIPGRALPRPPRNPRRAFYFIDELETRKSGEITIEFFHQETLQSELPGAIKSQAVSRQDIPLYDDAADRELMSLLLAHSTPSRAVTYYTQPNLPYAMGYIPADLQLDWIKKLAQTGRLFFQAKHGVEPSLDEVQPEAVPLQFDEGEPWRLLVKITKEKRHFYFSGFLVRGTERIPIEEPALCLRSGLVIFQDRIARLETQNHFGWLAKLRDKGFGSVPESDSDELVEALCADAPRPLLEWPEELEWKQEKVDGTPSVVFSSPPAYSSTRGLLADLRFTYADKTVSVLDTNSTLLDKPNRRMILRDSDQEQAALERLSSLDGFSEAPVEHFGKFPLRAFPTHFPLIVKEILSWGWKVEAHGKQVKQAGKFDVKVSSGVDWFDLDGRATYSDSFSLGLPALISALERGENLIPLGDGTLGILPLEWLKKYSPLAQMGNPVAEGYRFTKSQGALLGAWLSAEQSLVADPDFSRLMKDIASFGDLKPRSPARSFQGELRTYQKEGLAWLDFLKRLGLGGILADDMGLGKTIQVLAHLEAEYTSKSSPPKRPSIIILPKSLLFNWQEEARRFTPKLRVLAYTGQSRRALLKEVPNHDLLLVTYPIIRLDFEELQKIDFHYVIADEAQAIKNAESITHKACRLIRGTHRLVMTGTPVENSINDLFAMLDFVSPGLLGRSLRDRMSRAATFGKLDTPALQQLSNALKPFILRRTKGQVLKDLPEKMEKVLHCELSAAERKTYNELRDFYRSRLRGEIERNGIARSKIIILEALLRLRQAACHPGLIDKKRLDATSTKIDTLLTQLQEVISEGHKALVFSQFTSFLDIVEKRLTSEKITFNRLDGKTSSEDRRARVTQFQEDPSIPVFLVSLKAGGVGLNLTAADYVFILDPWWNPAAESQAIDRTHRIGQKNKVIAYRLITKDTVEEKIAELQQSKRALADAIITADTSLLRKMTAQDVEILLS